jgi:hypothetical protein
VELFKKHWRAVLGIVAILPSLWRWLVWLFDWGARVDLVITKLREHGGAAAVIEFLINPPSWFIFPAIIIGLLLIWWDTARRQKPILGGDQANFRGVVVDQPPIGNPSSSIETAKKQERVFVPPELTPERLLSFYEENTAIRAAEVTNRYIGQWMNVSVTVGSVSPFNGYFSQVSHERPPLFERKTSFDYAFIYLKFKEPWVDRLAILNHGDKITAICRIETIYPMVLNLDNCELVDTASK